MKIVQEIKTRIWKMKGVKYAKTLAKIQVGAIFDMRDVQRNVLPKFISTWIYENRVSKHFVISFNFPRVSLFTALVAYVVFVFGCFVVRDLCRSGCRGNFANSRAF